MYPVGKVPLLITKEGKTIAESDVIMRYLDESKGPESLLARWGEAEFKRAETLASKLVASYYRILYTADFTEQDANLFREGCQEINDAIKGPYFLGNEISLADFLLLAHLNRFEPVMARLDGIAPKDVRDVKPKDKNYEKWPRLGAFLETMRRQPFVESVRVPVHTQAKYAQTLRQGLPNPDLQD
ncbi:unnamed protein product [Echinostoma caproni]|uniref:Glutathione S-transferase n=1 Tax=Echinostoma caproni TaxID=27848 RepID=A0A183ALM3_9TREM|nr:unnamed protein product [Echinostoma caproni]